MEYLFNILDRKKVGLKKFQSIEILVANILDRNQGFEIISGPIFLREVKKWNRFRRIFFSFQRSQQQLISYFQIKTFLIFFDFNRAVIVPNFKRHVEGARKLIRTKFFVFFYNKKKKCKIVLP